MKCEEYITDTNHTKHVFQNPASDRLDKIVAANAPDISRSYAAKLIESGQVFVNGVLALDASRKIQAGVEVEVRIPPPVEAAVKPNDIPLNIVYEDDDVIVLNKQAGLTVHPAAGHYDDTLVNGLIHAYGGNLSAINGVVRPGIVHRLDKDTSGLMIIARNDHAHSFLQSQFADRTLSRVYTAICNSVPVPASGVINAGIGRHPVHRKKMSVLKSGGREAITIYKVLEGYREKYSLVECTLKTGRTHQIRVHLSYIGCPLLGDTLYGGGSADIKFPRQALHAGQIRFIHPKTKENMHFTAPLPEDMQTLIAYLSAV